MPLIQIPTQKKQEAKVCPASCFSSFLKSFMSACLCIT